MENTELKIEAGGVELAGSLKIPDGAKGIVVFAHGSGSSRHSPRNIYVADVLFQRGFATLLFDLLTPEEDAVYENRFDIDLLSARLVQVVKWLNANEETTEMPIGFFGASSGSAAALKAAGQLKGQVKAVVSRGGRPDLVLNILDRVAAPVLLIVGELDPLVFELNRNAFYHLRGTKTMEVIPGATHLFEEEGTLEKVAIMAADWFEKYLW